MTKAAYSAHLGVALALSLLRSASAATTNSTIDWTSCTDWNPAFGNFSDSLKCGYFDVPLDWADESVGTAHIAVVRYPATSKEKKGSVFINPGSFFCSAIFFSY